MEITDFRYKKSGDAVITLENGEKYELDGDTAYIKGYKRGTLLTEDALFELKTLCEDFFAYKRAALSVAAGENSKAGLIRKLRAKGATESAAKKAVDRLAEMGFLDESAYAVSLCKSYGINKALGRSRVLNELYAHGIPRDIAAEAADKTLLPDEENIENYIAKKLKTADLSSPKTAAALHRAGYPYSTINHYIKKED